MLITAGNLFNLGFSINWEGMYFQSPKLPIKETMYKLDEKPSWFYKNGAKDAHPLLGSKRESPLDTQIYENTFSVDHCAFLVDHCIADRVTCLHKVSLSI